MSRFDVSFKDCEGDEYESNFDTKREAIEFIRGLANEDCRVVQTWEYDENDEYKGSFY